LYLLAALLSQAASRCSSAEPASWRQIGNLPAAEAHQAAAADGQYVYAIASRTIAKYDRTTGAKLGESTGAAEHLNSGVLRDGTLYCAHSNYPQVPEQSEIKRLDLRTMELSTFHSLGNCGGSLTWCVLHDGHWWCNFARYGAQNHETFLVQFDTNWNEVNRFTYPGEVIRQLGTRSLSGGLWRDGLLLTTGHDDPVLFRFRLPTNGTVLELVDQQAIPFQGQGIATDPQTDGLIGIDRKQKQVLFAILDSAEPAGTAPVRLRVLTYNVHHGEGTDAKLDLDRVAGVIRAAKPDLVALQEVDRNVARTGQVDQPAELAARTGLRVAFGGNLNLGGGQYGNAILSRFPILVQRNHPLPGSPGQEPRGLLEIEALVPHDSTPLNFFATHFDHHPQPTDRLAAAQAVAKLLAMRPPSPALLAGDLNAVPDSPVLELLSRDWLRTGHVQPTSPSSKPKRQIDYVLVRSGDRWRVLETQVIAEAVTSDHRPFLAVLELLPASIGD
jgi:endonuclease/exonuclease/phosphatase family metal-dependent hydrolase